MKILSLFDGMSVAQQALKELGYNPEYYASEIDEYAIAVAQSNFPNTVQLGSVLGIKYDSFDKCLDVNNYLYNANFDLLIGGSPCQDLSIAKKNRKGLDGERSGLFYEYVRIRNEAKPKYFILENVASMSKESKDKISEVLGVQPVMINAALVSAQNRKRLFWIGKLNDKGAYDQILISQPEDRNIYLKDILEHDVADRLKSYYIDASYYKGSSWEHYKEKGNRQMIKVGQFNSGGQGDRVYSPKGKSVALSALGGGRGAKTGLYAVAQRGRNIVDGKRKDILGAKTEQRIEIKSSEKSHTITSVTKDSMVMQDMQIRKLTPTECLRLQSMPDNYFDKALYKGKPISNTQRYKMCGNAFNCAVIKHILTQIKL